MDYKTLICQNCGAPLFEREGIIKCDYCGTETIIESKKIEEIGEKVKSSIYSSGYKTQEVIRSGSELTQLELRRLQLTQELSSLQIQLSNLRSEKRNLVLSSGKSKIPKKQIAEIEVEEKQISNRIQEIRDALNSPQLNSQTSLIANDPRNLHSKYKQSDGKFKSQGATLFLAIFFGFFGVHRFYTGHIKLGVVYFFTAGLFGIGWIIDIIRLLTNNYKDSWGRSLNPMGGSWKKFLIAFFIGTVILFFWITINPDVSSTALLISYMAAALIVNIQSFWKKVLNIRSK